MSNINTLNTIFEDIADLREYVPFVGSDIEMQELQPSSISAQKQIKNTISQGIWDKIVQAHTGDVYGYLKTAFGNLTMSKAITFTTVAKRLSGGSDVYKYEVENMRRQYISNYYDAMDSLVEILATDETYSGEFTLLPSYKLIDKLKIKNPEEMEAYYPIDRSYLFFFRTMPIQREVLDEITGSYYSRLEDSERSDLLDQLNRAHVFITIGKALTRFDIIELPATIRSLFDDQKSFRHGSSEKNSILKLASQLIKQGMDSIQVIDQALDEPEDGNIDTGTAHNVESDKIFFMP